MALADTGCTVDAVCPPSHPLNAIHALNELHRYDGLMPLRSFARAIAASRPDLVIPSDDLATSHLHRLYSSQKSVGDARESVCELIERSLGAAEHFGTVSSRARFMEIAEEQGIRVPRTKVISDLSDLRMWATKVGFPTVLKVNGSSGGDGVKIVRTMQEAEQAFRRLQSPPMLVRAAKRILINRDNSLLWPSVSRHRPVVNAQVFVAGNEATSAIACWKGVVLASLHFEVLNKRDPKGPATVVRLIDNSEMSSAAEKMARRLGLSGLHGLDFMLEPHNGKAYLIEINPRTTQVGHLTLGPGHDLPAALYTAVTGESRPSTLTITENDTIALFPQEWLRDPNSVFLQSAFHDVPWKEPELIRACIQLHDKDKKWQIESGCFRRELSGASFVPTRGKSQ
jgi:carbamoyl-phosphate synthase L subunit-like protein